MLINEKAAMKRAIAIVIMFCLANETVKANEIELGFAAAYSNNGIESDNQLYPYISYSNDTFYFEGTSMGLYLTEGDVGDYLFYDVSTFISYELNGFELDKSLDSYGKESPKNNVDLGIQLDVTSPFGGISFSVQRDVSNTHNGNVAALSFGYAFGWDRWSFSPIVNVDYLSKEFVNYYYGIHNKVRLSSTVNKSIGYLVSVELSESWIIGHSLQYGLNGSAIKNSPLVDSDKFVEAEFVITYVF